MVMTGAMNSAARTSVNVANAKSCAQDARLWWDCMEEQVFFYLLTYYFGQDQSAHFGCAERQSGLVEPPGRDDASSQDVGVQEQADAAPVGHFSWRVRERGLTTRAEDVFP